MLSSYPVLKVVFRWRNSVFGRKNHAITDQGKCGILVQLDEKRRGWLQVRFSRIFLLIVIRIFRTRHAACPVLIGNKWVSNKWTHEFGNEFVRRCDLDKNCDNDSLFWDSESESFSAPTQILKMMTYPLLMLLSIALPDKLPKNHLLPSSAIW